MMIFAKLHPRVLKRLPIEKEWIRLPRQWIMDILHATVPIDFKIWLDHRISARDEARRVGHNMDIAVTEEVLNAFQASTHYSSTYQTLNFLISFSSYSKQRKCFQPSQNVSQTSKIQTGH
jgi:hypothetical protein